MPDTLIRIFLDAVSKHAKPAQFMRRGADGWESISSERAQRDVESLGFALLRLGVARGDRVAMLSESRYEWPVADLAILGLGGVTVPLYPTLTAAQCRSVIDHSEARVIVVSTQEQLDKLRSVRGTLTKLEAVVCIDVEDPGGPGEHGWRRLMSEGIELRKGDGLTFLTRCAEVGPQDLATIIYTSGTTGEPKGAMLTHHNIASNVAACLEVVDLNADDTCLSFLPLSHIFERMGGLYAMLRGGATIAYARGIDTVAADAVEVRPTVITGVPRFYEKVHARVHENAARKSRLAQQLFHWGIEQGVRRARAHFEGREVNTLAMRLADRLVGAKVRERMGGRLRFGISGGAALSPEVMEFFFAIGIPVLEGYGLTETSPVICLNPPGRERPGSVGPPVPGVEVRLGDHDEILTRGPHVMRGYFRDDEATRAAIRDGWFHTGDVGRLDPDGYLRITDRLKDLLVLAGGKKVAPQPIESRLKTSPLVQEAVLLGDRRPFVVALIAPEFAGLEAEAKSRGWKWTSREELVAHPEVVALFQAEVDRVNKDLAPFESVRRFAVLPAELTLESGALTPTLKVKRRVMTANYGTVIQGLYEGHATFAGA